MLEAVAAAARSAGAAEAAVAEMQQLVAVQELEEVGQEHAAAGLELPVAEQSSLADSRFWACLWPTDLTLELERARGSDDLAQMQAGPAFYQPHPTQR